jgi:hypothetical protein
VYGTATSVAIKVFSGEFTSLATCWRFLREIGILPRLRIPTFSLIGSGAADGLLYYVITVRAGRIVASRLVRDNWLPVQGPSASSSRCATPLREQPRASRYQTRNIMPRVGTRW